MTKPRTLFDKIWDAHLVHSDPNAASILYIDRHLVHEVTSPQAFEGLRNTILKTATPTVAKPIMESALNENWFGAPIAPEQMGFGPTIPKSNQRLKNTREFYTDFAKVLNEFSGGNDYRSGPLDVSPATMQYVAEYFGSGPLRLGTRTYDAIDKVPVDLIFALIVPEESTDEHLQILAMLAKTLSNTKTISKLRKSKNSAEIFTHLTNSQ